MSRSPEPARPTWLACHGECRPDPGRRDHHDRLLMVETDPDALLDLFDVAVTWSELQYPAARMVAPGRWLDFAARHRWQDPGRVQRIFGLAADIALRAAPVAQPAELELAAGG